MFIIMMSQVNVDHNDVSQVNVDYVEHMWRMFCTDWVVVAQKDGKRR